MGGLSHTVSGDIASFRTPSRVPIESIKFHFLPKQAAGTPSLENPIPITGWTGLSWSHAKKNLFDKDTYTIHYGKTRNDQGIEQDSSNYFYVDVPILLNHDKVYLLSVKSEYTRYYVLDKKGNFLQQSNVYVSASPSSGYLQQIAIANVDRIQIQLFNGSNVSDIMLEELASYWSSAPNRDAYYEPFYKETGSVSWADDQGVIYGGYFDPVRGKLVAEWAYELLNDPDKWDVFTTSRTYYYNQIFSRKLPDSASGGSIYGIICTIAPTDTTAPFYCRWTNANLSDVYFALRYSSSNENPPTLQDIKDSASNGNIAIAYKLATPIEYNIAPRQLKVFLDHNNFWSDANDITEVTYPVTESKDILKARKLIMAGSQPHIETVSGPIASFDTDAKAPVKELKAYFTPVQEGSGDASPQNIRPITGITRMNIEQTGKNLIDLTQLVSNSVWWNDKRSTGWANCCTTPLIPVKPGATYYLKRNSNSQDYVSLFDRDGKYVDKIVWGTGGAYKTMPDNVCYVGITIGTAYLDNPTPQLELGSIATAYEPYVAGSEIPIEFPAIKNLVALNLSPYAAQQNPHVTIIKQTADELEFTTHGDYTYEYVRLYYMIPAGMYTAKIYASTTDENDDYNPLLSLYVNGERVPFAGIRNGQSATFTLAEDTVVDMRFFGNLDDSSQRTVKFSNFQIERGSVATDYESRAMVYGGYIDLVRNKVVATHGFFKRLYGPSNPGGVLGDYERHGWNTPMVFKSGRDLHDHGYGPGLGRTFCNIAPWDLNYFNDTLHYYIDGTVAYVMLPVGTDANTEIEFCAELATPIEYDITPQILKTLKGTNNIWSDLNGNVEVKYWTH